MKAILTQAARQTIIEWLSEHARKQQNVEAWFEDAEWQATDSRVRDVILELRGSETRYSNVVTLRLDPVTDFQRAEA